MLANSCWKFYKPHFSTVWTKNFQMFKLDLEKVEEPEIKLPISSGSKKKQNNSKKTPSTSALLTTLKPLTVWITTDCGNFLEMWLSGHLNCLLRNLYTSQEATVRNGHGTIDWLKLGKGVQVCILSPCLFNLYAEYIMQNAEMDESQAVMLILPGEISEPSDMQMTPH